MHISGTYQSQSPPTDQKKGGVGHLCCTIGPALTAIKALSHETYEIFSMTGVTNRRAMVVRAPGTPLALVERPPPDPKHGQVVIDVHACGVCRTDLHVVDGELDEPRLPIIPGHEVVGRVAAVGQGVETLVVGQRVGVPWLGSTCGTCAFCRAGQENLCIRAGFTGYTLDGGYA